MYSYQLQSSKPKIQIKLFKQVISTQKQPIAVSKVQALCKMDCVKSCEIQGGSQEITVMVKKSDHIQL